MQSRAVVEGMHQHSLPQALVPGCAEHEAVVDVCLVSCAAGCCCLQNKNMPDNLNGVRRRFVKFGGGISEQQLAWLEQQLQVSFPLAVAPCVCGLNAPAPHALLHSRVLYYVSQL